MKRWNMAIIGVSGYGDAHYKMLLELIGRGVAKVAAATVVNREEERVKCESLEALGAELFDDYRDMLNQYRSQLDLCLIPTGMHLHAEMTIRALESGTNVYVEKPLAATVQDALAIARESARSRKYVAVGYQHMYDPGLIERKRHIVERIGDVILVKQYGISPRDSNYYARNGWAGKICHNGRWVLDAPFHNAGAHELNLMCFLAGAGPDRTAAIRSVRAELYRGAQIRSCDIGCLDITTISGAKILYFISHCGALKDIQPGTPQFVIKGTKGALGESPDGFRQMRTDGSLGEVVLPGFRLASHQEIADRMADILSGKNVFICSPDIATPEVVCSNGAFESAPIVNVPTEWRENRLANNSGMFTMVKGLGQTMKKAFDREKLFSEIEVPWAAPGQTVDMVNYQRFDGGKTGIRSRKSETISLADTPWPGSG